MDLTVILLVILAATCSLITKREEKEKPKTKEEKLGEAILLILDTLKPKQSTPKGDEKPN